jgi:hypothetical protein
MQMQASVHSGDSIRLARSILDAWSAKDVRRLHLALAEARLLRVTTGSDHSFESERCELLCSVGTEIESGLHGRCGTADSRPFVLWMDLLRNLVIGNS